MENGNGPCIVAVAESQIGYTEGSDGYTKYGDWYDSVFGTSSFKYDEWCTSFVSWCANRANVSTSVIPIRAYAPYLAEDFMNQGRYYSSRALGGSYTPKTGDIIFLFDTYSSPRHVGVVRHLSNNTVYYIDGNAPTTVEYKTVSLTSTNIVAFGNPNYSSTSHPLRATWSYDSSRHWQNCPCCNTYISGVHNMMVVSSEQYSCMTCGYTR